VGKNIVKNYKYIYYGQEFRTINILKDQTIEVYKGVI
jgi:hypothetical protein